MLRLCIFAFVVYAVVLLIDMQIDIANRNRQLNELAQRVETQRISNKELERQLAMGMDQEHIERVARERLGFIAPDETVFVDVSGS
ncbi:MAG: septum formation initiator family protein [Oscillospiraceae bacterium]|nr:septum formation initiator family protein [Oscillospiraceae bacterium]